MLYEQTIDNLTALIRELGVVKHQQLLNFFSDSVTVKELNYYLQMLMRYHMILYDKQTKIIQWHCAPKRRQEEQDRRIESFWIPVSFQSKNIKEIISLAYPFQLLFITHEDEIYDVASCNDTGTAQICKLRMAMASQEGLEDEVNHILLTNNEETGKKLCGYGFDSFCVLDEKKRPCYFEW